MQVLVSLSGGMDSATVLYEALAKAGAGKVHAVSFFYGSKHNDAEIQGAQNICNQTNVPHEVFDISTAFKSSKSALMQTKFISSKEDREIPTGHYEQDNMKETVVAGRNTIMTSILMGIAESRKYTEVWVGIHDGDHAIYPDCRPMWFYSMSALFAAATEEKVSLQAPFLKGNKTSIIKRGLKLGVPYHLTRTCYNGQDKACGRCGSCQERLEAFAANNTTDPVSYETRKLLPKSGAEH